MTTDTALALLAEELAPQIDFGCGHTHEEYIDYAYNPPRRWSVPLKGKTCAACRMNQRQPLSPLPKGDIK